MTLKETITKWKGTQAYLNKVITAMPEDAWDFKPTEGSKTFHAQLSHLTTWIRTHGRFVTGQEMPKPIVKTREDLLKHLDEGFFAILDFLKNASEANLVEVVDVFYGKRSKSFILSVMDNHLAHHRGQLIVYLRMKKVKPPAYRGW